jgi:predicted nucleic-acid-binding Zn-ribbon protein
MTNDTPPNEEWDIPVHVTESDDVDLEELEQLFAEEQTQIPDQYAIICPVCGYDEFEDIWIGGKKMLGWTRSRGLTFAWNVKKIQSLRCLRCDYILNFARE